MGKDWKKAALVLVGFVTLVVIYFGPSEYRKAQMDKEVDRLCALDGGIKVYERVILPEDKFDRFGNPAVPLSTSTNAKTAHYVLVAKLEELVKGGPNDRGQATLHRFSSKAIRVSDDRVLGEAVGYYRRGGDTEGPWHISHYTGCTDEPGKKLAREIFVRMR